MADINKLKKRIEQIDAQKQDLKNKLAVGSKKNANGRKFELAVHLLKLAETDKSVHETLAKVWAVAKLKRPNAFIDVELPKAPLAGEQK